MPAVTPEQKSMDLEVNGNRESACPASLNATRTKCLARTQTPWELSSQSMMKRWLHSRIFLFQNKRVAYIFKRYVYPNRFYKFDPFTFFLSNSRSFDNAIISMISILSFNFTLYLNLIQQTINKLRNHWHSIHCIMSKVNFKYEPISYWIFKNIYSLIILRMHICIVILTNLTVYHISI